MSIGYTYIVAMDGKYYRNPVIKTAHGKLFFDDGEPEILFRIHGSTREPYSQSCRRFLDSIDNIVAPKNEKQKYHKSHRRCFGTVNIAVMLKRVPARLISSHEGVFEKCPGEGFFPAFNGPMKRAS